MRKTWLIAGIMAANIATISNYGWACSGGAGAAPAPDDIGERVSLYKRAKSKYMAAMSTACGLDEEAYTVNTCWLYTELTKTTHKMLIEELNGSTSSESIFKTEECILNRLLKMIPLERTIDSDNAAVREKSFGEYTSWGFMIYILGDFRDFLTRGGYDRTTNTIIDEWKTSIDHHLATTGRDLITGETIIRRNHVIIDDILGKRPPFERARMIYMTQNGLDCDAYRDLLDSRLQNSIQAAYLALKSGEYPRNREGLKELISKLERQSKDWEAKFSSQDSSITSEAFDEHIGCRHKFALLGDLDLDLERKGLAEASDDVIEAWKTSHEVVAERLISSSKAEREAKKVADRERVAKRHIGIMGLFTQFMSLLHIKAPHTK
jgi:hypothetical protein